MPLNPHRFTIYDMMEAKGLFASNPANAMAREPHTGQSLYKGPVAYPKMFYHPEGKTKITIRAEVVNTPYGPTSNSEQRELISRIANNKAEADGLKKLGWHEHPADAIAAGFTPEQLAAGATAPAKGAENRISTLEAEKSEMEKELAELRAMKAKGQLAGASAAGPSGAGEAEDED